MKKILLVLLCAASLAACTPPTEQLMSPVQLKQPITFSSKKDALIYWDYGKITSAEVQADTNDLSPGGMLISAIIQSNKEQHDQDDILIRYGKAQQVIFLTSLRDILQKRGIFSDAKIIVKPQKPKANQVIIGLNFIDSKVLEAKNGYPIHLVVQLTIQDNKGMLYNKTFTIQPDKSIWSKMFNDFEDSQEYTSDQLMKHIVTALNQVFSS